MSPMLSMVLDVEVERHKREVAEGFAAVRAKLLPPPPEREIGALQALMAQQAALSPEQIARRMADMQNCAARPMLSALYGSNFSWFGALGGQWI